MQTRAEITLYKPNGDEILTAQIGSGSKLVQDLMQNDYIKVIFSTEEAYRLGIGTYTTIQSEKEGVADKKYILNGLAFPTYDTATGAYKYDLQMDAWYMSWNRYVLSLSPTFGSVQTSFSYTQTLPEHMKLVFAQLQKQIDEGDTTITTPEGAVFHYNGHVDTWVYENGTLTLDNVDETEEVPDTSNEATFLVKDEMRSIRYENQGVNDAIASMCNDEAFNCEWWMDDNNYIHFGRCEYGTEIELNHHEHFEDMQRASSSDEYGTRIIAFGATTNVPSRYRKKLIFEASDVHTKNGYTHFTDAFRKPPVKLNTGSRYNGFVAKATIPHTQTTAKEHEYVDEMVDKQPTSTSKNRYLGRKTTTWQGREMYDCVEKTDYYHDYKIVTYSVKGGDKVTIKGMPTYENGHYLFKYNNNSDEGGGNVYSGFYTSGEVDVEIRPTNDCTLQVTVSGTVEVTYYESTYISYHRIENVNENVLPKLQPGKYIVYVDGIEYDFRINGEFKAEADQLVELEIEVYEEGAITMDIINNSDQYVDLDEFEIEIEKVDFYAVQTKVKFLSGSAEGRSFQAFLNMDENTTSIRELKVQNLNNSKDSFHLSISGTNNSFKNGDKFVVEGFINEEVQLSYFTDEYDVDTNIASYERRLMLPVDRCQKNYIDSDRITGPTDIVTIVKTFDDIYPSQVLQIAKVETYTEQIKKYDDNGSSYYDSATRYRFFIKKADLDFKTAYISTGQSLQCKFQNGILGGLTFDLSFEGNTQTKDDAGNSLQAYVIVSNTNNSIEIPNNILKPNQGDKIVLLNYNPMSLQDMGFVEQAEERLYNAAMAHLDKISLDAATYTMVMLTSEAEAICEEGTGFARIGQKVKIDHEAYFDEPRATRVIGTEQNLDIPWDSPVYKLGESLKYSRLGSIEKKLKQ